MSIVLDYINTHNLPLVAWLNADAVNINISTNAFTWVNKKPDTDFDFTQSNSAFYPTVTTSGISFGQGQFLKSRLPIEYSDTSYTVLHISTNTNDSTASLVSQLKAGSAMPEVDYAVTGTAVRQVYTPSLLSTAVNLGQLDTDSDTIRLGISHDVKQGRSSLTLPGTSDSSIINIDTSHKAPSSLIQIGGNTSIENLYHLLIFNRKISASHVHQLLDLLLYSTPVLNGFIYWDLITTEVWELMIESAWDNLL